MFTRQVLLVVVLSALFGAQRTSAQLLAHVELSQTDTVFSYTLFNDESIGSANFLSTFHLAVDAPITVTSTPVGWDFSTDNRTYVDWFNTDTGLPYPHDVAPGSSLSGFIIQSTVKTTATLDFTVTSWDHIGDTSGPTTMGFVAAPSGISAVVPEPGSFIAVFIGTLAGGLFFMRRKRK